MLTLAHFYVMITLKMTKTKINFMECLKWQTD